MRNMDGRKNSRSRHTTSEGLKVKVKSSRANPTLIFTEDRKGSIYEINIHSSFDFHRNMEEADGLPAKMSGKSATIPLPVDSEDTRENRSVEIPLTESHYSAFQQKSSEVRAIPLGGEKMDSNVQTEHCMGEKEQERKTKCVKKADKIQSFLDSDSRKLSESKKDSDSRKLGESKKDSDSLKDTESFRDCDGNFKQRMKNFIIENFISKDDDSMKTLFKNFCEKLDNDQLHLHHHEHHHHYYFDNTSLLSVDGGSMSSKQGFTESRKANSSPGRKNSKEKRPSTGKEVTMDKTLPKQTYYFKCPGESNLTFTKTNSGKVTKNDHNEVFKVDKATKIKGKKSSGFFTTSRSKFSSSAESILNKKSDFITTHIYSDTELVKSDSTVLQIGEVSETPSNKSKEFRRNPTENYSNLMDSLKSFNHFLSPVVITDQKTTPKISYVKCECASMKSSTTTATGERLINRSKSSRDGFKVTSSSLYTTTEECFIFLQVKKETAPSRGRFTDMRVQKKKQKDEIQNLLPYPTKRSRKDHQESLSNKFWKVRLKTELSEVKSALRRIEEKHLLNGKSATSGFIHDESIGNFAKHKISIFASKTVIYGTKNLIMAKRFNGELFDSESRLFL